MLLDWRVGFQEQRADEPRYSPALAEPSGWLALEVDAATGDGGGNLDDTELIDAVIALERLTAWAAARQARLLAEFIRRRPGDDPVLVPSDKPCSASRYAPDEVALALSQSRFTAKARLGQSVQLTETLTDTLAAWEAGRIDGSKVRAICDAILNVTAEVAIDVQDRVLARASGQSLAQLKASLKRAVIAADPDGAAERLGRARTGRRVGVGEENDGMASLWALLPAPAATASFQWLTRLARGLGAEDPRGMDARRADLMADLLTGNLTVVADGDTGTGDAATVSGPIRAVTPGKPLVQVVMPHSTLLGADDQPCELVGYGPIPAELAREIAADAVWTRLVTDPLSGALLDHGRTTYRPPAALADFVRARDVYCRYPVCRRRAADAELDHTVPFPEGPTAEGNLYSGCTHHHHLKHDAGWTVVQHRDGRITWTTPTGHAYTSEPHDHRPEPGPPPLPAPIPAATRHTPGAPAVPPQPIDRWGSGAGPISAMSADDDPPPF